jgi:hypothetical protein
MKCNPSFRFSAAVFTALVSVGAFAQQNYTTVTKPAGSSSDVGSVIITTPSPGAYAPTSLTMGTNASHVVYPVGTPDIGPKHPTPVPDPSVYLAFGTGILGLIALKVRQRSAVRV